MMEINEIWMDCKGYNGKYQVSNLGRVWSVVNQKILKTQIKNDGYEQVRLYAPNGKGKQELVHRLVALAFLSNPFGYTQVNHKDGDRSNNQIGNLEWISSTDNMLHKYYELNSTKGCFPARPVECIETGEQFPTVAMAMREKNCWNISKACRGELKTSGGYHWRYIDD